MLFVEKGYCRFAGKKCRYLKVQDGLGYCKKKTKWYTTIFWIRNEKTGKLKNISSDQKVNIKAPSWCPKL